MGFCAYLDYWKVMATFSSSLAALSARPVPTLKKALSAWPVLALDRNWVGGCACLDTGPSKPVGAGNQWRPYVA
eukprot:scaffold154922_cov17-Tisochrysis_lutea.AAC.1